MRARVKTIILILAFTIERDDSALAEDLVAGVEPPVPHGGLRLRPGRWRRRSPRWPSGGGGHGPMLQGRQWCPGGPA